MAAALALSAAVPVSAEADRLGALAERRKAQAISLIGEAEALLSEARGHIADGHLNQAAAALERLHASNALPVAARKLRVADKRADAAEAWRAAEEKQKTELYGSNGFDDPPTADEQPPTATATEKPKTSRTDAAKLMIEHIDRDGDGVIDDAFWTAKSQSAYAYLDCVHVPVPEAVTEVLPKARWTGDPSGHGSVRSPASGGMYAVCGAHF